MHSMTQDAWIRVADKAISKRKGRTFPPVPPSINPRFIVDAFASHHLLLGMRKTPAYEGDEILAQAEHFAWARAMVCWGGLPMYYLIVDETILYDRLKQVLEKRGKLHWAGYIFMSFNGKVSPSSKEQVAAGIEGAQAGLRIGSPMTASLLLD